MHEWLEPVDLVDRVSPGLENLSTAETKAAQSERDALMAEVSDANAIRSSPLSTSWDGCLRWFLGCERTLRHLRACR